MESSAFPRGASSDRTISRRPHNPPASSAFEAHHGGRTRSRGHPGQYSQRLWKARLSQGALHQIGRSQGAHTTPRRHRHLRLTMAVALDLADIQGNILSAYGKLGFPKGRFIRSDDLKAPTQPPGVIGI